MPDKIFFLDQGEMKERTVVTEIRPSDAERKMLSDAGYADPAINYYLEKKYMGHIENADQTSEKIGSCGDIMRVYLKIDNNNLIDDVRYEITGCAGAISAAMAAVDLVKGKTIDDALKINDGDIFKVLGNIPEKKHHCIQLAVKTMHKGIQEYRTEKAL
ncbi:iron-sulfur cluster assembly scaffold protein [Desulfobacula sp.]|uniref:iron-sulfur cluster assembly scaffold protein n=1 Tax=Desulfobacula sp. TaxID=2593537 RepID=UPI0025BA4307|nr:iron-sulfur cluster assembly scaffold protein [Desulfobacula sp.]